MANTSATVIDRDGWTGEASMGLVLNTSSLALAYITLSITQVDEVNSPGCILYYSIAGNDSQSSYRYSPRYW
jgi:hypothetical protein